MHKPELLAHTDSASGDSTTRKLGSGYYIVHDLEPVSAHPPTLLPHLPREQGLWASGGRGHGGWEGEQVGLGKWKAPWGTHRDVGWGQKCSQVEPWTRQGLPILLRTDAP